MTTSTTSLNFTQFTLTGVDAEKFLQGQITANTTKLNDKFLPTAISNLKGRVEFGLWLKKLDEQSFAIVISEDCADSFAKHIKKYGAFSKMTLSAGEPIFAVVENGIPTFSQSAEKNDDNWEKLSIEQGNYWITSATQGLFQPQELRLHQRGGVDYDKGCYLGQEIIARLWFKASPKAWLHRIGYIDDSTLGDIQVVNTVKTDALGHNEGYEALVVARPEQLEAAKQSGVSVLSLPNELEQSVSRNPL